MASLEEHLSASLKFQEFYDETLRKVGLRAPQPVLGDTVNTYRRETLRNLKRTFLPKTHPLYEVQFRQLKADALQVLESLFSVLLSPKPTIRVMSSQDSFARSKNSMNSENSKPLNGSAQSLL